MDTQAAATDIPVKVGTRRANLCVCPQSLTINFCNGKDVVSVSESECSQFVLGPNRHAVCFSTPHLITPGTKKKVSSIVISSCADNQEQLSNALLCVPKKVVDTREVPTTATVCERATVQLVNDNRTVVIWEKSSCKAIIDPAGVVLQRTKGGMSTYDVHLLHRNSNEITTVEMLPHSDISCWYSFAKEEEIYDLGPDPIDPSLLQSCYDEDAGAWDLQELFFSDSDEEVSESGSEYELGDSSSSEESLDDVLEDSEDSYVSDEESASSSSDEEFSDAEELSAEE